MHGPSVVLERYPDLESIREIDYFVLCLRRRVVELFGDRYFLDDVEHEMIRGSGLLKSHEFILPLTVPRLDVLR